MKNKKFDCNYIQIIGFIIVMIIIIYLSISIGYKIRDNKIDKVLANDDRFKITETSYCTNLYVYCVEDTEYENEYIVVKSSGTYGCDVSICPVTK